MSTTVNRARKREWTSYLVLIVALWFITGYILINMRDLPLATLSAFALTLAILYWKDLEV